MHSEEQHRPFKQMGTTSISFIWIPILYFATFSSSLSRKLWLWQWNFFIWNIFFIRLLLLLFLLLMFFLNIVAFNFVQAQNKSLRFRRLRKAMYNTMWSFQQTTAKFAPHFWLNGSWSKQPHSFFCDCLSQVIMHLRNVFLLSTPVASKLLTPRWVSRRKDVK